MSDNLFDHLDALPPGAMRDEVFQLIRNEGVAAAVRAAVDVLRDRKAAAAARATMASLIFKLAGYLEKPDEEDPLGIKRMSAAEIRTAMPLWERAAQEAERNLAKTRAKLAQLDTEDDIFA